MDTDTHRNPRESATEPGGWNETRFGEILDRGDYVEIPIVEEILVKKPVVREVLRIRKEVLAETELVEGTVRIEELRRLSERGEWVPAFPPEEPPPPRKP